MLAMEVELKVRIHYDIHRPDKFAKVMYLYPWGRDTIANAIKERILRKDYEFFLARVTLSKEILGWVALSFNVIGNAAENEDKCEAGLEWTEMCSHILKDWKIECFGEKSNIWDTIKRASSILQAKHLPPNYCIINTLVLRPGYEKAGVATALIQHVIAFWRNRVIVGAEWAIWVQAPPFVQELYTRYGFKEVGECKVDLDNYGFFPEAKRSVSGKYTWKFMILREASGSATKEPDLATENPTSAIEEPVGARKHDTGKNKEQSSKRMGEHASGRQLYESKSRDKSLEDMEDIVAAQRLDKGNSKEKSLEDVEERVRVRKLEVESKGQSPQNVEIHVAVRELDKGKRKEQQLDSLHLDEYEHPVRGGCSEHEAEQTHVWEEAEERLEEIRLRWGPPPLPGEVACLIRVQSRAEDRRAEATGLSKGKGAEERSEDVRTAREPLACPLQHDVKITGQPQDNYVPTKSEDDLIDLVKNAGVDVGEIDIVKAPAFSLRLLGVDMQEQTYSFQIAMGPSSTLSPLEPTRKTSLLPETL